MTKPKIALYGMTLAQLQEVCVENQIPKFGAKQIADWLYKKGVQSIDDMSNISAKARVQLSENYMVGLTPPSEQSEARDGTKKYLFQTGKGEFIESAYIPDRERATLCLSTQVGCRMGCKFCATAKQGLTRSLSANEILNQIVSLPEREKLTNIVLMGMGEPFDNLDEVLNALSVITSDWGFGWSPTRITLSTAGVTSKLERFIKETNVHLAVSLHNPFGEERAEIMPIERAYPIAEFVEQLRKSDFSSQRRLSFEYIIMSGLNNSPRHIKGLCQLLGGLRCRINIIKFHKIPDSPYFSPSDEKIIRFRDTLTAKGLHTTIRQSRGEDIKAACGLLSTLEKSRQEGQKEE